VETRVTEVRSDARGDARTEVRSDARETRVPKSGQTRVETDVQICILMREGLAVARRAGLKEGLKGRNSKDANMQRQFNRESPMPRRMHQSGQSQPQVPRHHTRIKVEETVDDIKADITRLRGNRS